MTINVESLKQHLCTAFCADVRVSEKNDFIRVSLPLTGRDGDHHTIYLKRAEGGWRLSDMGSTLMRLSYDNDTNTLLTGPRGKLFDQILTESGVREEDGEIYTEVQADRLLNGLFQIGQSASRIEDLGLWSKSRVESTFKEDLKSILLDVVSADDIEEDYIVPNIENASLYPIDFHIKTPGRPLYLFGVNTADRARISTIVMQHLIQNSHDFDSFVVCSDFYTLPRADGARLMNAANDMVQSLDNVTDLQRKLKHRIAQPA